MTVVYKIHPAIGAARIGNSTEYYLAPETAGGLPLDPNTGKPIYQGPGVPPQNIYHDASGALKKQAARFKLFAYDDANPADPGTRVQAGVTKVNGKTVSAIEWTVYLANKKASWFQFEQLTGSGQEGDAGYNGNNANNKKGNPLRFNKALGTTSDPATINDGNRRQLILDPGSLTVSGASAPAQDFKIASKGLQPFDITTLGQILTDADGNLLVLGGQGCSGTTDKPMQITAYANNNGWFDDVSDGPVTAVLVLDDGTKLPVDVPSWVICGPPKYAPELINIVTLYDTLYDVFVRNFDLNPALFNNGFQATYQPNHTADIVALLSRPNRYQYVAIIPPFGRSRHAGLAGMTSAQFKANVASFVRGPDRNNVSGLMPYLAGDNPISNVQVSNYLTLTATQAFMLSQFANGVVSDAPPPPQGEGIALDRASLENCVGGAFCPGIEMTWICRNTTIYRPLPAQPSMSDAFRIRHKNLGGGGLTLNNGADNDYSAGLEPGDITKYMAQPWQADFNECSDQNVPGPNGPLFWWWPVQRPYSVVPAGGPSQQLPWTRLTASDSDPNAVFPDLQMVTNWKDVGFILNVGAADAPRFVEIERNQKAISDYPGALTS